MGGEGGIQWGEKMSIRYTTWGSIRGGCDHEHRTLRAAYQCLRRDQRGSVGQGGYSDRHVRALDPEHVRGEYDVTQGPGRAVNSDEQDELDPLP